LGSFFGGFALVASLVFLSFELSQIRQQVRQAERDQRSTIAQGRRLRSIEGIVRVCDASMAEAYAKATRADADLTMTQLQQFLMYALALFVDAEDTFLQNSNGQLDDKANRAWLALFGETIADPAIRLAWRTWRGCSGREFAEFVEKMIEETPVRAAPSPAEMLDTWKSGFAELRAPYLRSTA
jgi:hypothetical protein